MELHPKNRPTDKDAEAKFIAVTEAYNTLRNVEKRRVYDNVEFGELPSYHAHRQFVQAIEECPTFHADEKNQALSGQVKKLSHKKKQPKQPQNVHKHYPTIQSVSEEMTK